MYKNRMVCLKKHFKFLKLIANKTKFIHRVVVKVYVMLMLTNFGFFDNIFLYILEM